VTSDKADLEMLGKIQKLSMVSIVKLFIVVMCMALLTNKSPLCPLPVLTEAVELELSSRTSPVKSDKK